jgi:hypothetical protein
MKILLIHLILLVSCQAGLTHDNSTPEYLAVVQQKMPGNIISDEESAVKEPVRHFKRSMYILVQEQTQLLIDSISWNGQPLIFEMAKLATTEQSLKLGTSIPGDKMIQLKPVASKTWWMIQLSGENEAFSSMEKLLMPVKIYSGSNIWIIDKEVAIAPAETY